MTAYKVLDKNHKITTLDKWEDIYNSVFHYMENKISYESKNMINSSYDAEDIRSELNVKMYSLLNGIKNNWDIENKKISDIVNFCARCLVNHVKTLKKRFAERVDYSFNTARVDDLTDKEDTDAYLVTPVTESDENDVIGNDNISSCLLWLLTHGLLEEYVLLKTLLYNPKQTLAGKSCFVTVCKQLGITNRKIQSEIKTNLLVRLVQFGIIDKSILPKNVNLLGFGILF